MIECSGIIKEFGEPPVRILHGLTFTVPDGQFVALSGRSGSGKSTLLYIVSTLDEPTEGTVRFDGRDISDFSVSELHSFRNHKVGFIFQFHYLLPELTALENVLLPARNLGKARDREKRALALLERLEIGPQAHKLPGQMSGGEQQRVAIARALILEPSYIFADEPTGNLDTYNSGVVMDILKEVNREHGTTIFLVTHEPDFAAMAQREIFLVDGRMK